MSISEIIQLGTQLEKLGIVGFLGIVVAVMGWALYRYRKELVRTYRQRDKARMVQMRYKTVLDGIGQKVDISDIEQLFKDDLAEEV